MTRLFGTSCAVCVLSAAATFAQQDRTTGDARDTPSAAPVTMSGCVVRQSDSSAHPVGSRTPGGGTIADTNAGAAPTGTATTGSTNRGDRRDDLLLIVTASRTPAARPGPTASATDSGTIPAQTRAGTAGAAQSGPPTAYHLVFARDLNPASYVGQRVEVTGVVKPRRAASEEVAHPSAELSDVTVQTIKRTTGSCDAP